MIVTSGQKGSKSKAARAPKKAASRGHRAAHLLLLLLFSKTLVLPFKNNVHSLFQGTLYARTYV